MVMSKDELVHMQADFVRTGKMKDWLEGAILRAQADLKEWRRDFEAMPWGMLDWIDDVIGTVARLQACREARGMVMQASWARAVELSERRLRDLATSVPSADMPVKVAKHTAELRAWASVIAMMKSLEG